MDRSGEEEKAEGAEGAEAMAAVICNAAGPRRSGRCVQKKLDFYRSRSGADDPSEDEDEREGSDWERKGKRKKMGNGKKRPTAPTPTSRKAPPRKESLDSSEKASHFFLTIAEKKLQRKLEIEYGTTSSLAANKAHCDLHNRVGKSPNCKDATPVSSKSACSNERPSNAESTTIKSPNTNIMDKNQPNVDLWHQAKIDAEENNRLSAGRQVHPFFSNWKTSKKMAETLEVDKILDKARLNFDKQCPPIHVFETNTEETVDLNWSNWKFDLVNLLSTSSYIPPDYSGSGVFDGSVGPLSFGNTSYGEGISTYPLLDETKRQSQTYSVSSFLTKHQETQNLLLSYLKEVHEFGNTREYVNCCSLDSSLENVDKELLERLISFQLRHTTHSHQNLWISKYQPEKASEVCGNVDAVKFVSEWLQSWHEQDAPQSRSNIRDRKSTATDSNCSSFNICSETDSEDEVEQLGSVLLVTGPVGCGKSAAIYACAKEQGFEVIEVNSSDHRNGALVKLKFGEATESHGLNICSVDSYDDQERSHNMMLNIVHNGNRTTLDEADVTSWTCREDIRVHEFQENGCGSKATNCQVTNKSLLLFEDVDTVFEEDRGFLGTILQLAEASKRPIILTTNSKDPVLPRLLVSHTVDFIPPPHEDLLSLVSMICAVEESLISPMLLKLLIKSCQADIRRTISNLQFWCQGVKGENNYPSKSAMQFDLDALHLVIPQIIPLECPCKLSEMVEKEIVTANVTMKEMSLVKKKEYISKKYMVSDEIIGEKNNINFKNCSILNLKGSFSLLNNAETSDISCSPVKFSRRSRAGRSVTVVPSDSDEEQAKYSEREGNGSGFVSNNESPVDSLVPISLSMDCCDDLNQVRGPLDIVGCQELVQSSLWLSESHNHATAWENNVSENFSFVPESEFISNNAELGNRTDNFVIASDEAFVSPLNSIHTYNEIGDDDTVSKFNIIKNENTGLCTESVHGTEDLQDLEIGSTEFFRIGSQFVDECSRADCNIGTMSTERDDFLEVEAVESETVQETWARLRNSREELKSYLTSDQNDACQILKLITGMTGLISDADTMLSGCAYLTSDIIQPNRIPCLEPHHTFWYDQLLEMTSIFGEHGLCHYMNSCASLDFKFPCDMGVNLSQEILGCSSTLMTLGKHILQGSSCSNLYSNKSIHWLESFGGCLSRDVQVKLRNTVLPTIPLRSCMVLKGYAFHEYISCLSHVAKLEKFRLSQRLDGERLQRRARASQHYLQSFPLSLSPEDVMLLEQQCCFGCGGFG